MSGRCLVILVTVCLLWGCVSPIVCVAAKSGDFQDGGHIISYTREYLLSLQHTGDRAPTDMRDSNWTDSTSQSTRYAKNRGAG